MYQALDMGSIGIQMPIVEGIALAAKHGYKGITMSLDGAETEGPDNIRAAMERHGIMNAGMGLPWNYMDDEQWYDVTLAKLRKQLKTARAVGCTRMSTGIMSASDQPYDERYDCVVKRLRPLARMLGDEGITMGMEFLGPSAIYKSKKYPFIRTLPELMRLADSLGAGNCGVLLDAYHCHTAGHGMDIAETITPNRISVVHINDAMAGIAYNELPDSPRMLPGETGVVDCKDLLLRLFRMGYEGPVYVEPFYEPFKAIQGADTKAAATKAAMDSVWPVPV